MIDPHMPARIKGSLLPSDEEMGRFFRVIDVRDTTEWAAIALDAASRLEASVADGTLADPLGVAQAQAKVLRAVASQGDKALLEALSFRVEPIAPTPGRSVVPIASSTLFTPYAVLHLAPYPNHGFGVVMEATRPFKGVLVDRVYADKATAEQDIRQKMKDLISHAAHAQEQQAMDGPDTAPGATDATAPAGTTSEAEATEPTLYQVVYTSKSYANRVIGVFDDPGKAQAALDKATDDVRRNSGIVPIVANTLHTNV